MSADPSGARPSLIKNPYVIAFIAAAVVLAVLRPFLRRIPDAPIPIAAMPHYELTDREGHSLSHTGMLGVVYVAGAFSVGCSNSCREVLGALSALEKSYRLNNVPVELVAVCVDDSPDEAGLGGLLEGFQPGSSTWRVGIGSQKQLSPIMPAFYTNLTADIGGHVCETGRLLLVDWAGQIRGYYGVSEKGIDETFYRATHVLRERAMIASESGERDLRKIVNKKIVTP